MPGLPLAAGGTTLDDAALNMVEALREYAEDRQDHLFEAPNHRDNRELVQMIRLLDDEQLRDCLVHVIERPRQAAGQGVDCSVDGPTSE